MNGNGLAVFGNSGAAAGVLCATSVSAAGGGVTTWATSTSLPDGSTAVTGVCFSSAITFGSSGFAASACTLAGISRTGALVDFANAIACALG